MTKQEDTRVLARKLARLISKEELEAVSGGYCKIKTATDANNSCDYDCDKNW